MKLKVVNSLVSYLSNSLEGACGFQLVYTMALGLAISGTLWYWALASSTADTDSVYTET